MDERTPTKTILARNLRYLMDDRIWTQTDVAKRAHIDQKVISYVLRQEKVPTLDSVDAIASAFGLTMWHLIMPTLIEDLQQGGGSIRELYDSYFDASAEGRKFIRSVAKREADQNKEAS